MEVTSIPYNIYFLFLPPSTSSILFMCIYRVVNFFLW